MSETAGSPNWWQTFDVRISSSLMPSVFVIECKECGELFETYYLESVPGECPECGAKGEE